MPPKEVKAIDSWSSDYGNWLGLIQATASAGRLRALHGGMNHFVRVPGFSTVLVAENQNPWPLYVRVVVSPGSNEGRVAFGPSSPIAPDQSDPVDLSTLDWPGYETVLLQNERLYAQGIMPGSAFVSSPATSMLAPLTKAIGAGPGAPGADVADPNQAKLNVLEVSLWRS